jgi:hypothetical protein
MLNAQSPRAVDTTSTSNDGSALALYRRWLANTLSTTARDRQDRRLRVCAVARGVGDPAAWLRPRRGAGDLLCLALFCVAARPDELGAGVLGAVELGDGLSVVRGVAALCL